jgi:HD superfamily phosphodiesterase
MDHTKIIKESRTYISQLLTNKLHPKVTFHTLDHTKSVVRGVALMAQFYGLSQYNTTVLMVSAWFHDSGHIQQAKGHEKISQTMLKDFFKNKDVSKEFVEECCRCIGVTQLGRKPKNLLESIIKDADFFHITSQNYWAITEQLKEETEYLNKTHISKNNWYESNLKFLNSLRFATNYYNLEFHGIKDQRILENKSLLEDIDLSEYFYPQKISSTY